MSNLSANLQPLISVIIPAYNRWHFLQQAIASVMAQIYTNWELIIVDDGSTDETKEGIQTFNDKRIHVSTVPHCGNIAMLRNAGVKASTGEWIAFLDSDDVWLPGKLQLQLEHLQKQEKLWSYCAFELMNETGHTIPARSDKDACISGWITKELLVNEVAVTIVSIIVHRKLFEELNGFNTDPGLIFREDYELILRLSQKAEVAAVPDLLLRVREHYDRSTNTIEDGNMRTAFMYGYFAKHCPERKLKRIARARQAHHETEIAVNMMKKKKYGTAIRQLSRAFWKGDKLRHILSALRRGTRIKKKL